MSLHISWRFAVWFPDTLKKQSESGSAKNSYRKKIFIKKSSTVGTDVGPPIAGLCGSDAVSGSACRRLWSRGPHLRRRPAERTDQALRPAGLWQGFFFLRNISPVRFPPCHLINCRVVRGKSQYYNMQLLVNVTKINFLDKFKILYFFNNSWILLTCPNYIQSLNS